MSKNFTQESCEGPWNWKGFSGAHKTSQNNRTGKTWAEDPGHHLLPQSRWADADEVNWVSRHLRTDTVRTGRPWDLPGLWDTVALHRPSGHLLTVLFSLTCLYYIWDISKVIQITVEMSIKNRTKKGALCQLSYSSLTTTMSHRWCYLHFTAEKTGTQNN